MAVLPKKRAGHKQKQHEEEDNQANRGCRWGLCNTSIFHIFPQCSWFVLQLFALWVSFQLEMYHPNKISPSLHLFALLDSLSAVPLWWSLPGLSFKWTETINSRDDLHDELCLAGFYPTAPVPLTMAWAYTEVFKVTHTWHLTTTSTLEGQSALYNNIEHPKGCCTSVIFIQKIFCTPHSVTILQGGANTITCSRFFINKIIEYCKIIVCHPCFHLLWMQ